MKLDMPLYRERRLNYLLDLAENGDDMTSEEREELCDLQAEWEADEDYRWRMSQLSSFI